MDFTIEFKYTEDVIPPRCRKPRPQEFQGSTTVTVPDVNGTQDEIDKICPVVFISYCHTWDKNGNFTIVPTVFRGYDGELYVPSDRPLDYLEVLLKRVCETYSEKGDNVKKIRDEAETHLIINGELYNKSNEPVYEVMTFGLGGNHGGTSLSIGKNRLDGPRNLFRADELDEAKACAASIALGRGDTESVQRIQEMGTDERIEVFDISYSQLLTSEDRAAVSLETDVLAFLSNTLDMYPTDDSKPFVTAFMRAIWKDENFQKNGQQTYSGDLNRILAALIIDKFSEQK